MELSKIQEIIALSPEKHIVVNAAAASGKTTVLVTRIQHLLDIGTEPSSIVAITFTNNAAQNIKERLTNAAGVFIGTVHSYANYLLLCKGVATQDILEKEQFDRLFKRLKDHPECIKPVEHLLWDEVQDSTEQQFELILDYINPKNWFLVGDWRQSIYGFLDARPDIFLDLTRRAGVKVYNLNENYRNDRKVLNFAKGIIRLAGMDYIDDSIPMSTVEGKVIEAEYEPVQLARFIKMSGNYGSWFVLTRTNEQIDVFSRYLEAEKIPYDTFKRAQLDNAALNKKLNEDTVKVLTIHSAKGLEAGNVAVIGARFYNIEERCLSYVAATRAKHLLLWMRMPTKARRREKVVSWER